MSKICESMTCGTTRYFSVRAWVSEEDPKMGPRGDVLATISRHGETFTPEDIALSLDQIPGIAAYEILDVRGNGIVFYHNWP